jgi:integrase
MAYYEKRKNSYRITVTNGVDSSGNPLRERITWTPPDGLTLRQEQSELNKFIVDFERLVKSGRYLSGEKLTLSEFVMNHWLPNHALPNLKPKTYADYCAFLENRILPALGHLKLSKIQPNHIIMWLNQLDEDGMKNTALFIMKPDAISLLQSKHITASSLEIAYSTKRKLIDGQAVALDVAKKAAASLGIEITKAFNVTGDASKLSENTKGNFFRCLSSILSTAVQWQVITDNPCKRVKAPSQRQKEIKHLTPEEALKLYQAALEYPDIRIKSAILTLLLTGIRESELAGLEWSDIDFSKGIIHIQRNSQYIRGKGIVTGTPKTESGNRRITIKQDLINVLKQYKRWQSEERLRVGDQWIDSDRLFTTWNGSPINNQTFIKWNKKFLLENGHKEMTVHGWRHTHVTMLIAAGTDIRTIAGRAGHSKASTTTNVYAHFLKSADEAAANTLFDFFHKAQA